MKQLKLIIFLVAMLLLVSFKTDGVLACRCAQPENLKVYHDRASLVFLGEVVEIGKELPPSGELSNFFEVKFKVKKWWKGGNAKEIIVLDTKSTCSPEFKKGKKWLVYAVGEHHTTNVCDGTVSLKNAEEHLKVLGEGSIPTEN
ncbi:MAG: hypothetical protein HY819_16955 [Acidobacteria bacterium]|nr:hypothetical protein [Acidobacteriota bacterium]